MVSNTTHGLRVTPAFAAPARRWRGPQTGVAYDPAALGALLQEIERPLFVVRVGDQVGVTSDGATDGSTLTDGTELLAEAPAVDPRQFGDPAFRATYGVSHAYAAGAMANGIASEALVEALGGAQLLASFGAAGLVPARVAAAINRIRQALPDGPYAFNLIHSPSEAALEERSTALFLEHGVTTVEASAYLELTASIVQYRAAGLSSGPDGTVNIGNRIIAKVSRHEVARHFLSPAPAVFLQQLVTQGKITPLQARLAETVPMADDLTAEADSGGHTDNRPLLALLPALMAQRDELQAQYGFATPVRVGAAGGIGTPEAVLAAYAMGAAYVVTGSVNQSCKEAGTSPHARRLLSQADFADVIMAPAADMFELGVKVQLLKRGTLFPLRAQKLYELYRAYDSLEAIPAAERQTLERQIFRRSLDEVWADTEAFFRERDPEQLQRAAEHPRRKMALVFRWYLGLSSRWSNMGEPGREMDYQIWCGPAMGAFNRWAAGSFLEDWEQRSAVDVAFQLLRGAAYTWRVQQLRLQGVQIPQEFARYRPTPRPS